jgi:hypothetical protein
MTRERAEEFGAAWNSGNADLITSFFADDGVYHASVGPDHLGKSYFGKENIRRGVQAFFDRFPDGKFENLNTACYTHTLACNPQLGSSGVMGWASLALVLGAHYNAY